MLTPALQFTSVLDYYINVLYNLANDEAGSANEWLEVQKLAIAYHGESTSKFTKKVLEAQRVSV